MAGTAACDAPDMLWRAVVVLAAVGFVFYRVSLAWEIRKARRRGDRAREQHLRTHGFGLHRWAAAVVAIFVVVLVVWVWSNSR
jgi:hypothetical protein